MTECFRINSASQTRGNIHAQSQLATLQHSHLSVKVASTNCSKGLFATEQVTLLCQSLSTCLVTLKGSCHLLILQPLVADELQLIISLGCLQILVGGLDETGGQLVLLLQGGVSQ